MTDKAYKIVICPDCGNETCIMIEITDDLITVFQETGDKDD